MCQQRGEGTCFLREPRHLCFLNYVSEIRKEKPRSSVVRQIILIQVLLQDGQERRTPLEDLFLGQSENY